ncbi:MAG: hypothetical protein NW224_08020 [Leptolyngbyaceae cyanobacterium bins.302]|nr:hypothetical protein [Leptolyngbyaceae cyanobacterium bins.302]
MTQAAPASPSLLQIVLGGGGILGLLSLAGGYTVFLINKHISLLDQANKALVRDNEKLTASLTKAESDAKAAMDDVDDLFRILETIRESDLSADDAARLKRVLGGLRKIQAMQQGLESYKAAARWLDKRKSDWCKEAARIAIQKYPKLVPLSRRRKFQENLASYLNWIYTSLYVYGHPDAPLSNFVQSPVIPFSQPYIAALEKIKNNGDRDELSVEQSICLEKMIDELIEKIHADFKRIQK